MLKGTLEKVLGSDSANRDVAVDGADAGGRGRAVAGGAAAAHVGGDADALYGQCLADVFKEYLPYVAEDYTVRPMDDTVDPANAVASFDVLKLVLEKHDKVIEKLKNVYHMLASSGGSLALIVRRRYRSCRLTVAVGTQTGDSEEAKNLAGNVRDALLGNFPGTQCGPVLYYSDADDAAFAPLNADAGFGEIGFNSVGVVTNIATDFAEEFSTQGIEKLIDGIRLGPDGEYTVMMVGKALPSDEILRRKNDLYRTYTGMSPFAKVQRSWGTQSSETWTRGVNAGISLGVHTPVEVPYLGSGIGANLGVNASKSSTNGTTASDTVTITEYGVTHMLQTIARQMERIERSEALGLWRFATYILSPDVNLVREASHMYLSLTQGNESFFEHPSINIWNANRRGGELRGEIARMRSYLTLLRHPVFVKRDDPDATHFNQANWPSEISCTAELSGSELTRAMNIPRSSIPGLPVIECAPFGREVSSYDPGHQGDVVLGRIHHMHHDEEMPVALSGESLTSHVLVVGSTGSGKSNTVYELLAQSGRNFLVVEPAKGEYRHMLGDVQVFGADPLHGRMLQVNPFAFPEGTHVYEHVDRLLEVFNVCWPMYAAMPAVLREAVLRAYRRVGWDLKTSRNETGRFYPTFQDVCGEITRYIDDSAYSSDTKGDYKGALVTRLESLTNGVNGRIFCEGDLPDATLFDGRTIVDLSRLGSSENRALIMGILVVRLQEYRMSRGEGVHDESLKHITVLEEAHNLLRNTAAVASGDAAGGIAGKSVEMLGDAIAQMRTYGEGFVIVDQAPGLLDRSVIRNTNTKIIMRLPDQSDRELVGRAANLNDDQIQELARLQRGVAAVYQNEWVEPVLCHVNRYERPAGSIDGGGDADAVRDDAADAFAAGLSDTETRYLNSCIYDPLLIDRPARIPLLDCVARSAMPNARKAALVEMTKVAGRARLPLFERVAYEHFGLARLLDREDCAHARGSELRRLIDGHLRGAFAFLPGCGPDDAEASYRFVQAMLAEHGERLSELPRTVERMESVERLSRCAFELARIHEGTAR